MKSNVINLPSSEVFCHCSHCNKAIRTGDEYIDVGWMKMRVIRTTEVFELEPVVSESTKVLCMDCSEHWIYERPLLMKRNLKNIIDGENNES